MIKDLQEHYRSLFNSHENSPAAVQQPSAAEQTQRFRLLTEKIPNHASIIDVGCGLGDLVPFLRNSGHTGAYLGLDFLPEFVTSASTRFGSFPSVRFAQFDFNKDTIPTGFDYAVVSGAFNNRLADGSNLASMLRVISMLAENVYCGVAFNGLSTHVEFTDDELFYVAPEYLFDQIREKICKFVSLRHDYVLRDGGYPYEFTMYLQKHPAAIGGIR